MHEAWEIEVDVQAAHVGQPLDRLTESESPESLSCCLRFTIKSCARQIIHTVEAARPIVFTFACTVRRRHLGQSRDFVNFPGRHRLVAERACLPVPKQAIHTFLHEVLLPALDAASGLVGTPWQSPQCPNLGALRNNPFDTVQSMLPR